MPATSQPLDIDTPNAPEHPKQKPLDDRISKRIIICCDGTWQDGIVQKHRWQYSNIIKLSRMLNHQDDRQSPPSPQIVFYQSGVGSQQNIYSEYIQGATGGDLAEKVQEAYGFLAHNYQLGDEIYLFGFSRGAYTARMTAALIGEIGVLDRMDMDHFADIFIAYQRRGNTEDEKEIAEYNKTLEPWTHPNAKGRVRADADGDTFTVKVLGVWDTVGALGLPQELSFSHHAKQLFGFPDKALGPHIEHAFHAMGLNETRKDFDVAKFEMTQKGREKGQVLKQVWFAGSHSDVGGGYQSHDLADITLAWMAANIESMLSLNIDYLRGLPRPVAGWGLQIPHNAQTGIFELSHAIERTLPNKTDDVTHEYVHPSVMFQSVPLPHIDELVKANPGLFCSLMPLEEKFKDWWPYVPGVNQPHGSEAKSEKQQLEAEKKSLFSKAKDKVGLKETMEDEGGRPRYEDTWVGSILHKLPSVS